MSSPPSESAASFGTRAARGTFWTTLRYGAESALRLGSNLILTRLLFPEAFGLMALVNVVMTGLAMFSDIGLSTSVVQSPRGEEPRFLRTAWTLQVLRGVLMFGMGVALAGSMAEVYGQAELRGLVAVTASTALISGFNSMSLIQMQRHLELGRLAAVELASQLVAICVMIGWVLAIPTVWGLVGGAVIGSLVKLALSHALSRGDSAGFAWDRPSALQLIHFGKWIFLSTMLFFLAGQADRLLFGKLLSVAQLGVYGIALVLAGLPSQLLWSIGTFVLLPAFSRQAGSAAALQAIYRAFQLPVLIVGGLPVAWLVACGPELIEVLYDPRYADAGWMLQWLALGVWLQIPQTLSSNALLALGAPRWFAISNAMKLAAMLVLLPSGFALFGVPGAIAGLSVAEVFRWGTFALAARRHALPALRADLVCSVLVVAAALLGRLVIEWLRSHGGGALAGLGGGIAAVLLLWVLVSWLVLRREIPGLWARIRSAS